MTKPTPSWNKSHRQLRTKFNKMIRFWNLFLCNFWPLLPNFYLWKGDWVLGSASDHFYDFPNVSLFPKIVSLESFDKSLGTLHTMFLVFYIKYHFTCGESNLYYSLPVFHKFTSAIVSYEKTRETLKKFITFWLLT